MISKSVYFIHHFSFPKTWSDYKSLLGRKMLKTLLIRFGWVVFVRSQVSKNGKKNKTLTFSRFITFRLQNLGKTTLIVELLTDRLSHWNQYLRFARVVFEKSQKVSKTIKKSIFTRIITFCVKQFGHNRLFRSTSHNPFHLLKPKTQIRDGTFREKSKNLKKRSTNGKFDFPEGHNFLCKKKFRRNR